MADEREHAIASLGFNNLRDNEAYRRLPECRFRPRSSCRPGALVASAAIASIEAGTVAVDKAAAYSGILLRSFARLDAKIDADRYCDRNGEIE